MISINFPFTLARDQIEAVNAWLSSDCKGSIVYSTGTGKTEIALECARRAAQIAAKRSIKVEQTKENRTHIHPLTTSNQFNILFLVPRIVLIEQNIKRLISYGLAKDYIGTYFGERKQIRQITIGTYHSIINSLDLIYGFDMVIFDEVHLVSDTATVLRGIFDTVKSALNLGSNPKPWALLGLTATIDEIDPKYNTILSLMPVVKKYMIKEAVVDRRLARPVVIPIKAELTVEERKIYDRCTFEIRKVSRYLRSSNPSVIASILRQKGVRSRLARSWFDEVRMRKNLINCAENKLSMACDIISKHPDERIMVFSETIDSIQKLREMLLKNKGINSMTIDSTLNTNEREKILSVWGKEFYPLLSVHTLEVGYNVPEVRIALILATTSNMNQVVQRIGRVIRKTEQKDTALIYTIYLSQTHDSSTLKMVKQATEIDKDNGKKTKRQESNDELPKHSRGLDKYF
ncbi:MAG TPA: helicase-related protein [Nitrososphaeraceae archaeon]